MKKIKWGFLGTGRIAHKLADAIKVVDSTELYAIGSRNKESAIKFAEEYNVPKAYSSYEEVMKDPDVDVIYIATPHNLHFENTMAALENNKHVLCEKPLGVNLKEVQKMVNKAKEKNLFLMEGLWSRFLPNIIKTKELVDSGEIGTVKFLRADFAFKSLNGPEHRQFNIDLCGGTLLDIGIYNVFLSLLILGKPKSFIASAGLSPQGGDNTCSCTFKYDNDTLAVLFSSFLVNIPTTVEIHGGKGKIFLEHLWFCPGNVKIIYDDGSEKTFKFDLRGNGYEYEVEEVVRCIQAGKTQSDLMSWDKSIELISMLDAIRKECGIAYPKHDL
ncbi:MAG: Gfo/Idh/MocA family oxidoreductase [Ignavibacteriales bacterium]|nr:Gfo/Idh/MocA family oxidoreductase [Ignavibacteriales bacterium]